MTLGPCFHAPRHDPEACPHDDAWRFAWVIREPKVTARGVREVHTMFVRCMACGTIVSEGEIRTPTPEKKKGSTRGRQ